MTARLSVSKRMQGDEVSRCISSRIKRKECERKKKKEKENHRRDRKTTWLYVKSGRQRKRSRQTDGQLDD